MDTPPLDGRVALVTGGSRGIGRAVAERLAADGATVAVHYGSNASAAQAVVDGIRERGGSAFTVHCQFGPQVDLEATLWASFDEQAREATGSTALDIVVNNAGINIRGSLENVSEESFDQLFAVNVRTPFFLTQQALTRLRDQGRIINLSTAATRIARPDIIAYASTKGAIEVFTYALAQELGPRGITVNAVRPGIVDTDMNEWLVDELRYQQAAELSVMRRVGAVGDIADVVGFLASRDARWITGQVIDATGGSHL